MKLVDRVLDNISANEIVSHALALGLDKTEMTSVIHSMIPGILSAFKARLVSAMNSGDISPIVSLLVHSANNLSIDELFDDNKQAVNTVYQRVSALTDIDIDKISHIIPALMPLISSAISKMLQEFGSASLIVTGNDFLNDLVTHDNGYEKAINAANQFIGSVFGVDLKPETDSEMPSSMGDNFIQNLFDLFDQDNDGSVMDDIYHMLVR